MSPVPSRRGIATLSISTALLLIVSSRASGFALIGDSWPAGTDIVIHLGLSRPAASFPDGSTSWNASAADALQIWNQHLQTVRFVQAGSVPSGNGDGRNSVFFSSSVYGEKFGTNTIAVTVGFNEAANPSVIVETDVIFNSTEQWNSYRGPMRTDAKGNPVFDLHRVALHEFGHVLGLDHPDQHQQVVHALMNSQADDNDSLTDDDVSGAQHLYGTRKQEAVTGSAFSYQVTGGDQPSTYSATGLPPGLTIDAQSGVIHGIPTISGVYSVVVTASGPARTVTLTLQITVKPQQQQPDRSQGTLLAKFDIRVARLVKDPHRSRVYATLPDVNAVAIVDTSSLSIIATVPVASRPHGLAVSADGSKLWVACTGSTTAAISVIDLNSLAALPPISAPEAAYHVVEGLGNRLYASSGNQWGRIMQINAITGTHEKSFEMIYGGALLAISPDRRTLYAADRGSSPSSMMKLDVSTANPLVIQKTDWSRLGSNGQDLKLSHDGTFICFSNGSGNGQGGSYSTSKIPTSNLNAYEGVFVTGAYPGPIAFSGDDSVMFQAVGSQSRVAMFDTRTFGQIASIPLGNNPNSSGGYDAHDLAVDNTGALLFVATFGYPQLADLRIYATGRTDPPKRSPTAARTLINVSTRLRSRPGDDALIGGFIITGQEPKKVALRAIEPSLPVAARMADPVLSLYRGDGSAVAENDNWNSHRDEVRATGLAPASEHEAVITTVLAPGSYTAVVRGAGAEASGVALVELYDLSSSSTSRVANISTRGKVETGDNVMIGGFIVGGDQPTRVIVRAIGPSLRDNGVAGALEDTTLDLHDTNGALLASNDDWHSHQATEIAETTIAPRHDRESAIVRTLQPGNYTSIIRGRGETTGVALVEVYNLETH